MKTPQKPTGLAPETTATGPADSGRGESTLPETALAAPVDLAAENARLKAELGHREALAAQAEADEKIIAEKVRIGITREQAVAVIARQKKFDEWNETHNLPRLKRERALRQQCQDTINGALQTMRVATLNSGQ
jgi:hypothetical protein